MRDTISLPNAQDLIELLDDRFGRASTIADAVLDRLIYNAHRLLLDDDSQRKLRAIRSMPTTLCLIPSPVPFISRAIGILRFTRSP